MGVGLGNSIGPAYHCWGSLKIPLTLFEIQISFFGSNDSKFMSTMFKFVSCFGNLNF